MDTKIIDYEKILIENYDPKNGFKIRNPKITKEKEEGEEVQESLDDDPNPWGKNTKLLPANQKFSERDDEERYNNMSLYM